MHIRFKNFKKETKKNKEKGNSKVLLDEIQGLKADFQAERCDTGQKSNTSCLNHDHVKSKKNNSKLVILEIATAAT